MPEVLVDTDILSDVLKARDRTVTARESAHVAEFGRYAVSTITVMEIIKGLHKAQRDDRIAAFLSRLAAMDVLTLDVESAELAGRISGDLESAGQPIGFADPIIAAIAIHSHRTLVTANTAHYVRIAQLGYPLRLDNWRTGQESV